MFIRRGKSFLSAHRPLPRASFTHQQRHLATHREKPTDLPTQTLRQRNRNYEGNVSTMEDATRWRDMSPAEKVVHATKQTSYLGVVLLGLGLTGAMFYFLGSELFSPNRPSAIYNKSLTLVQRNEDVSSFNFCHRVTTIHPHPLLTPLTPF